MARERYRILAGYNQWANNRLFAVATRLSPEQYVADRGAFFSSVHGTLNHILAADRIWMHRFTGAGDLPAGLDVILFGTLADLSAARAEQDGRIISFIETLDEPALAHVLHYTNSSGASFDQRLDNVLDHFFNHQTHHRGQAHALLTHFLGKDASPSLDLIAFQREMNALGAANAPKA